jgi:hypothetical protein
MLLRSRRATQCHHGDEQSQQNEPGDSERRWAFHFYSPEL